MSRLDFNDNENRLIAEADKLEADAKALRNKAYAARDEREEQRPLKDRLCFAATFRCICGHGMAYDPLGEIGGGDDSPLRKPNSWECSGILLGIADKKLLHTGPHPFAFYEVKSDSQPSANGCSTREPGEPHPDALPASDSA